MLVLSVCGRGRARHRAARASGHPPCPLPTTSQTTPQSLQWLLAGSPDTEAGQQEQKQSDVFVSSINTRADHKDIQRYTQHICTQTYMLASRHTCTCAHACAHTHVCVCVCGKPTASVEDVQRPRGEVQRSSCSRTESVYPRASLKRGVLTHPCIKTNFLHTHFSNTQAIPKPWKHRAR